MTDGRQTRDPDAVELDIAADPIHRQGARVLVIGIGPEISQNELRLIAKDPSFVFNVQSFESLSKAVRDVAASACVNTGNFLMLLYTCFCFCCCSWYFLRVKRLGFIVLLLLIFLLLFVLLLLLLVLLLLFVVVVVAVFMLLQPMFLSLMSLFLFVGWLFFIQLELGFFSCSCCLLSN